MKEQLKNRRPIDFVNGKIHESEYQDTILKKKLNTLDKLNKHRKNEDIETGPNFIKEVRGGKNHSKYRKIQADKLDDDHLRDIKNQNIYYRTHIKTKKKYQTTDQDTRTYS